MPDPTLIRDGLREADLGDPDAVITHPEPHLVQVTMRTDDWDRLVDGNPDAHDDCGEFDQSDLDDAVEEARGEGHIDGWNACLVVIRELAKGTA